MTDDGLLALWNEIQEVVTAGDLAALERLVGARGTGPEVLAQALHASIYHDRPHLSEWLLERGAPIDDREWSPNGWTALDSAVEHERFDLIRELVRRGADVNAPTPDGMTPLHHAVDVVGDGRLQTGAAVPLTVIELLLELGADAGSLDGQGESPRQWAERYRLDDALPLFDRAPTRRG
jgi:ankyrin repeat protein